jgi:alanine dehydrogenase
LCENDTGLPVCVLDANYITSIRTGAVAGIAAEYLARENSENLAVLGSRELGRYAMVAVQEAVPSLKRVRVFSPTKENRELFAKEMKSEVKADITPVESVDAAVEDADIIIAATSASNPVLLDSHVKRNGLFIDSIGSHYEVEYSLFGNAKVVVECEQCVTNGHFSVAIEKGFARKESLYALLEDLVAGRKQGRVSDTELILFDSIGIAVEDATPAWLAYSNATKMGLGTEVDMYQGLKAW